jgi:DNA adenine methylase
MIEQNVPFEGSRAKKPVNVASVRQLSPFRYPGGKTWLIPNVRLWLQSLPKEKSLHFIEAFAGGGIVSLTVAAEQLADRVTMVELDDQVAAVWDTILNGNAEWLAERILDFNLTPETLSETLAAETTDTRELAFKTILKNRTFHGGIIANGSAPLKHGEGGKGIQSRWYAQTLACRIREIDTFRERITFIQGDAFEVIEKHKEDTDAVFFIDPPYTVQGKGKRAGSRLYTHSEIDHSKLFDLMKVVKGEFLMTYDNDVDVVLLTNNHNFEFEPVAMKNTHHAELTELLISCNLGWLSD